MRADYFQERWIIWRYAPRGDGDIKTLWDFCRRETCCYHWQKQCDWKAGCHDAYAKNATVTICHSRTKNLTEITQQADILVTAVGKAGCVTADMVKPGAIVLDVGINRIHGKTVGDVDYENVFPVASAVTPVPGGVGSVTTTMIIESIVKAGEHAAGIK